MTKNRSQAPKIEALQGISLLQPERYCAPGGLPIYVSRHVPNDIFHIQIEFGAGKIQQSKPLQSSFTSELLFSGTNNFTQLEIQEMLDIQGAFVSMESAISSTILNIYGLTDKLEAILKIVDEVLQNAEFPQTVFDLHRRAAQQKHQINMDKNSYVARREFLQALMPNHPIGKVADNLDFENITREDCAQFYQQHLKQNIKQILVVGALSGVHLQLLQDTFSERYYATQNSFDAPQTTPPKDCYLEKPQALQSTIRIGKILFTPKHPDYFEFDIVETILGGYFGSRLMQNLREDKGYTYGIGSGLTTYDNAAYFFISTEVSKEHKFAAMEAIRFEIERLQTELISLEELELARAYIQGQVLKSTDGAFAQMNQFLFAQRFDLDPNYLDEFLATLNNISPERIRDLAQQYLDWDSMTKVIVG